MYKAHRLCLIGSLLFLLGFPVIAWPAFTTKLSDSQIHNTLQQHFPQREYTAFARLTLQDPEVLLSKGDKGITLIMPIDATIPDQPPKKGHVRIGVTLLYNSGNGGLYLNNPRIIKFEMPGVTKPLYTNLKDKLLTILKNALPLVRIYKLKEQDLNHSLAKSVLKSYTISDGILSVEFGFN